MAVWVSRETREETMFGPGDRVALETRTWPTMMGPAWRFRRMSPWSFFLSC